MLQVEGGLDKLVARIIRSVCLFPSIDPFEATYIRPVNMLHCPSVSSFGAMRSVSVFIVNLSALLKLLDRFSMCPQPPIASHYSSWMP